MPVLPELLAPAGNPACALAAFEAGADAVYLGLKKFSARDRSENFDLRELSRITTLARRKNRKVYVALNTLVLNEELTEAARLVADAAGCGADALIVQDPGIIRLVREYFPFVKIHASTQMGIHNSAGLEQARAMGINRVILERQVTREELSLMAPLSPVELEIFVHGALCLSLSGRCLLSSALGNDSGNRGRCSQPCRRLYRITGGDENLREGFFLSPGDLSLAAHIPLIKQLGISSLKIEGRLRREDYVESTVRGWRILIDNDGSPEAMKEASLHFDRVPGRSLTEGFFTADSIKNLVRPDEPGAQGRFAGTIGRVVPGGFFLSPPQPGEKSAAVTTGDKLRINPPDDSEAILLTALGVGRRKEGLYIPCAKPVKTGSRVSRIGYAASGYAERAAVLPEGVLPATLTVTVKLDGRDLKVTARHEGIFLDKTYRVDLDPAQNRAVTAADLEEAFRATANGHLSAESVTVSVNGRFFFPAARLKNLRREFYRELALLLPPDWSVRRAEEALGRFMQKGEKPSLPAGFYDRRDTESELILPPFVPETALPELKKRLVAEAVPGRTIRITALFQLALLKGFGGLILKGGFPLPVCNDLAAAECAALGLSGAEEWPEWDRSRLAGGKIPVMATRVPLTSGTWEDPRGHRFRVVRETESPVTLLFPE